MWSTCLETFTIQLTIHGELGAAIQQYNLYLHVMRRFDVAHGGVVGVGVQQPQNDGNVIGLSLVRDGDRAIQVDQLALIAVIEYESSLGILLLVNNVI